MSTVVFLEHALQERLGLPYQAYALAERWTAKGHRVLYQRGLDTPPPGDVAILHVDLTVIPQAYLELATRYGRVVNGRVTDISKRRYSECILARGEPWDGAVIVKTDANYGGQAEKLLREESKRAGIESGIAAFSAMPEYAVLPSVDAVPASVWDAPGIIVEKVVAERDERGYYLRVWTFFGDRERSSRYRSNELLIKSSSYLDREAVPVPEELRAIRARLGFDFGKFDYVRHEGRYYLLDANRTPASPREFAARPGVKASDDELAAGLDAFLQRED